MNSVFGYLYRDGSNYKAWGEVVFAGAPSDELRTRIVEALSDHEFFIAEQIRVPECFFDSWPRYEDDHCWHEFNSLEADDRQPDDEFGRTIEQFVADIERASASGWNVFDPHERFRASRKTTELESLLMQRNVVHADPEIMGGAPVFVGTRVPVSTLFDHLEAGDPLDVFLLDFPSVSREQAIAALKIAREALEALRRHDSL